MHLPPRLPGLLLLCGALLLPVSGFTQPAAGTPQAAASSGNWHQLSAQSKIALAPLAERWGELSETQRSKWKAIAKNFDQLSPAEQQIMQTRMREWVALSPVQRNQARLNFNSLQNVSKDQKKSRWDEYQSLSEEEKRKLSAGSLAPAKTTAPSPKPAATDRLVQPTVRTMPPAALPPRTPIDRNTLLPIPIAPTDIAPSTPAVRDPAREASSS